MKEFRDTIREINARLEIPQPVRSRILLEVAADLQDMYDYFRDSGLSPHESRREALERCDLSDEALHELVQLHTSAWRRFMDRFSVQAQTRWERALLVAMLVFIAAIAGRAVVTVDVFARAHMWMWPAVAVTLGAVAYAGVKFYAAFIVKAHDPGRLRRGLPSLLVAAGVNILIGVYGSTLGFYTAASRVADDVEGFWLYGSEWLFESSSLLLICFTAAILVALLWRIIANKVARIEQAEAATLLNEY